MTRNFCVSGQGEPVLDQESSRNFNQVTNQTEVGGIGQLNMALWETGRRSATLTYTVPFFIQNMKKKSYFTWRGQDLDDFQFILI